MNDKLKELGSTSKTAIIARGDNFADSLSISPYCYATQSPIYLTESNGRLSDASLASLRAFGAENVVIVGGTNGVSDVVLLQLGPAFSSVRLAGSNRYKTSEAIANWEGGLADGEVQPETTLGFTNVALATGENFPDGLAAGTLCGANRSVLVLVSDTTAGFKNVTDLIGSQSQVVDKGYIIGGTSAVSKKVQDTVEGMQS